MTRESITRWCGNAMSIGRLLPMYLALGALKHIVPVRTLARWAWRAPRDTADPEAVRRAIARVWRTQSLVNLGDRDCLQRSLLLYRELSKAGAAPMLMVGFRRTADRTEGHAWVTATGTDASAPGEGAAYITAFCFGAGGDLCPVPPDAARIQVAS